MAQENLRSWVKSTSGYGYSYENDLKTSCESTWGDSEDDDQPEKDATCLMEFESQEVFMCKTAKEVWHTLVITHQGNLQINNCKIDLLTQEYKKFSISNEETIDSWFTQFNAIITSLRSLDLDYSIKNHVRKVFRALLLKWRAKVMAIEEAKYLARLHIDELIRNLKVYEMVLDNDGVGSKITTEKVKSLALLAKVIREQTSNDSDSQGESDDDVDEEDSKAFNLLARNFCMFFRKGNRFGRGNRFSNGRNRFGRGCGNSFGNKGGESSKLKGACYNCVIEGYFASEYRKPKENKAFIGRAWSNSEDRDEAQNNSKCLVEIDLQDGKVISGGNITHDSITITNVEHASSIAFNLISVGPFTSQSSEIVERAYRKLRKISRAMLDEQSIPQIFWCHAIDTTTCIFNRVYIRRCINETSYQILRNRNPSLEYFRVFGCKVFILNIKVHFTKFDPKSYEGVFLGYSQTSKAYIVLNKKTIRIEESLNVIFDENFPEPKLSSSIEDVRINEPIVQDLNGLPSLKVNVLKESYPKSLKEARGHPIEQVIGELNERTLMSKTKQA
nr:retrovirus-related Pol polyprotein from transposon TNT 1-94 [Tanacetum cinerariifolium]